MVTSIVSGDVSSEGVASSLLVSGSRDKTLIIWSLVGYDAETKDYGRPKKCLTGHSHFVTDLALSSKNNYLISSSWDKTLRLWNLSTCTSEIFNQAKNKEINTVCFSKDDRHIYSGGCEEALNLWNIKGEMKNTSSQENHSDWVSRVRFSPSSKHAFYASAGWDGKLKLWNGFFKNNGYIQAHDAPIYALSIASNGTFIATGGKDQTVKLFNISESTSPKVTFKCDSVVNDLAFNPMFRMIAAATDKAIVIWSINNVDTEKVSHVIKPQDPNQEGNDEDEDEESINEDDEDDEDISKTKTRLNIRFTSIAWSSDGNTIFAGCSDGNIQVFHVEGAN